MGGGEVAVPDADGRVQRRRREVQRRKKKARLPHAAAAGARSGSSQGLYQRLLHDYPQFRKTDAVLYLYGFSLRSEGKRRRGAGAVQAHLERASRRRASAPTRGWRSPRRASTTTATTRARSPATTRCSSIPIRRSTIWRCSRPPGATGSSATRDRAARRFKEVLDLGSGVTAKSQARAHQLTEAGRKRLEELKGEALEYLVQVFTEDERKGPKDAFDFLGVDRRRHLLAQGHRQARRHVLHAGALRPRDRVGAVPHRARSATTSATRIGRSTSSRRCARWTRTNRPSRSCASWPRPTARAATGPRRSRTRRRRARAQAVAPTCCARWPRACTPTRSTSSSSRRSTSTSSAMRRAAEAYAVLPVAIRQRLRRRRGRIICSATSTSSSRRNTRKPATHYLRGRQIEAGRQAAQEALLQAIARTRSVRQATRPAGGKKELLPTDKSMGEAIDLYADLFPARSRRSPASSTRTASSSTTHGEYDEAVKRFGLIVEKYPKNPAAEDAGDKILESLNKAKTTRTSRAGRGGC